MAADIPAPFLVIGISAALSMVNIFFFPETFPDTTPTELFLLFASVNFGLWGIWQAFIYPTWFSPLRSLPRPKVSFPYLAAKRDFDLLLTQSGWPPSHRLRASPLRKTLG